MKFKLHEMGIVTSDEGVLYFAFRCYNTLWDKMFSIINGEDSYKNKELKFESRDNYIYSNNPLNKENCVEPILKFSIEDEGMRQYILDRLNLREDD